MKPIGAYGVGPGLPPWVSFGMLDPVRPLPARRPGFGWVVQIGFHEHPLEPAGVIATRARARLIEAGLWDDVWAFVYGEEWYERLAGGEFAGYGLHDVAAHRQIVRDYLSEQQRQIAEVTGKPLVWVTTVVTPERQPPAHTGWVAVDLYPLDGDSPSRLDPAYALTEASTALPLVAMPRWFRNTTATQGAEWRARSAVPTREMHAWYAALLQRPRWVAALGFLWQSRPSAGLVGLQDMPEVRRDFEHAMGVR